LYLPSRIKLKYIGWFLAVLFIFPVFKDIFVHLFFYTSKTIDFSYRTDPQLRDLKEKNLRLSLELKRLQNLEQENIKLKKAIGIRSKSRVSLTYAKIIGFSPSTWRRIAYISAGKDSGIVSDSLAIDENGYLVGKIIEVKDDFSTLALLHDPYLSLPVFIKDKGMAWLQGSLRGDLALRYVESKQKAAAGDEVSAVWRESGFAVRVGELKAVQERKDDFFLDVRLEPSADFNSLREVFILD